MSHYHQEYLEIRENHIDPTCIHLFGVHVQRPSVRLDLRILVKGNPLYSNLQHRLGKFSYVAKERLNPHYC